MGHLLPPSPSPDQLAAALALRQADPGAMIVSLGPSPPELVAAEVRVEVADPALSARLTAALATALSPVASSPRSPPVHRLMTLRRARELGPQLAGSLVIVRATGRNARRLGALAALLESAGVAAIQVQCAPPLPEAIEAAVFALLEERRGQPGRVPLLLSPDRWPLESLRRTLGPRWTR